MYLEEQKIFDFEKDAKSVRLDVYVEGDNRVSDIEMQATEKKKERFKWRIFLFFSLEVDFNVISPQYLG